MTKDEKKIIDQEQKSRTWLNNFDQEDKLSFLILIGVLFVVAIIRSNFFEIPFERDEGAYSYYGKLLLEGKTPYKDFYEQKFVGIFYFFAFIVKMFGDTVKGMHMGFMFLNMATVVLLFFSGRKLFSPLAGAITAITYAIVSMTPNLSGFTVQSEHGVAFFVALGIFFYSFTVRENANWYYYFLCGIAMGCAFMVKTTGVFLVLWAGIAIVCDFFLGTGKKTAAAFFKRTLIYSAGVFFIVGVCFMIVAAKGAFAEMWYWTIEVPRTYVSTIKWEDGKQYLKYTYEAITKDYKLFWFHAAAAVLVVLVKNYRWNRKLMILTLMFFSGVTVFPGYYFYGHYWIQILPGLAIASGFTFEIIINLLRDRLGFKWKNLPYAYVAAFTVLTLVHLSKLKSYYFNPNYDRILRTVYGNNPFPETAKIAEYINANSKPEDGVVSIGSEPQIYFYTKKKCPSRHAYFSALVSGSQFHADWQREFVQDVEKAKPRYIVFYNHGISLMVQPKADPYFFEWFNKFVPENYNMVGCVDMVDGYMTANYVWKEQLANFKPQGQNVIYVYERKTGV